jgi:hypothetical protein
MLIRDPAYITDTSLLIIVVIVAFNSFTLNEKNNIKKIVDKKIADKIIVFE